MSDEREAILSSEPPEELHGIPRRSFLKGLGTSLAATAALAAGGEEAEAAANPQEPQPATGRRLKGVVRVKLNVNGQELTADVEPRTTLANTLRDHLDLTGTKKVCDRGSCGACTVMLDGKPVYSCSMLAVDAQGKKITTVEGLGTPDHMSPVQKAFVQEDALMCGFCTPGFVVSCTALLQKTPNPTIDQVKEACSGNVCRCGTYPHIFKAALAAAASMRGMPRVGSAILPLSCSWERGPGGEGQEEEA